MWLPFRRKKEERSLAIDDFLQMAGVPNTKSGEYVSAGTAESLPVGVLALAFGLVYCSVYSTSD